MIINSFFRNMFTGNETFEKLASMSLIVNLVVYLRTQYNLDALSSATIYNIWHATCNLSPLLGAFVSDAYIGKYRTLIYGSLTSTLVSHLSFC